MSNLTRNSIIVNILLIITLLIIIKLEYFKNETPNNLDFNKIPMQIDGWNAEIIDNPDYVYDILETKDVLTRRYSDKNGNSLILSIICSDQNTGAFHPPEICYKGEPGLEILVKTKEKILLSGNKPLETNKLSMKRNHGNTKIWYWFASGNKMISNYYFQQFHLFINVLKNKKNIAGLIKVTISSKDESKEAIAKDFINIMFPYIQKLFN